jgi:putative acetyltransferase
MKSMNTDIAAFRINSRQMVRELGFFQGCYAETDVSSAQAHILLELERYSELNLNQLVENLCMDKSAASRTVKRILKKGWIKPVAKPGDRRQKFFTLSRAGRKTVSQINKKADQTIKNAFKNLKAREIEGITSGIEIYARSLHRARRQEGHLIRAIRREDNKQLFKIIKTILECEFNETEAEILEMLPELKDMFNFYKSARSRYFVIEFEGKVLGGGGIAPINSKMCELQKMYLSKEARGKGLGGLLLRECLKFAKKSKYQACYLDTRRSMAAAKGLYEKNGFKQLKKPLARTGHYLCDNYYILDLSDL